LPIHEPETGNTTKGGQVTNLTDGQTPIVGKRLAIGEIIGYMKRIEANHALKTSISTANSVTLHRLQWFLPSRRVVSIEIIG
jgi:hypothetical protein